MTYPIKIQIFIIAIYLCIKVLYNHSNSLEPAVVGSDGVLQLLDGLVLLLAQRFIVLHTPRLAFRWYQVRLAIGWGLQVS